MISLLKSIGKMGFMPVRLSIALSHLDKRFLAMIPVGTELRFNKYQGKISVNIDTTYPIELQMLRGKYDKTTSNIIYRFLHKNAISIDVGANVGALTLLMAKIATQGTVIAIEPGPVIFERLKANIELNPDLSARIIAYQIGVGKEGGDLFWNEDANNRGNAGLLQNSGIVVPVVTLDSLVEPLGLEALDFIKIDVEGMEHEVIRGALQTISRFRPLVYFETLEAFREFRGFDIYGAICDDLSKLDYSLFFVNRNSLHETENLKVLSSSNTLAVPEEKVSSLIHKKFTENFLRVTKIN